jgi:hypothetical protein
MSFSVDSNARNEFEKGVGRYRTQRQSNPCAADPSARVRGS